MLNIEFEGVFGDHRKQVKLLKNFGGAGGVQVYIDNYYFGDLVRKDGGQWMAYPGTKLSIDDIQILGEIIDNYK